MRHVQRIALIAAATLAAAPVAAETPEIEDQWVCSAYADGRRDSRVDVSTFLTTSGTIVARYISWSPPIAGQSQPRLPYLNAPDITLYYDHATAHGIGTPTSALGGATSVGDPEDALGRLTLSVRVDGGEPWTMSLEASDLGPEYKIGEELFHSASAWITEDDERRERAERLESGRAVTLWLLNDAGQPVAQTHYDLTSKTERDRLFRTAWRKAEKLAQHPERCEKAVGELPPEFQPY